jgi:hypothetical protein
MLVDRATGWESRLMWSPAPVKDGHLSFTLLALRCGIAAVAGGHSDAPPDGQFCSARLRLDNPDPEFHTYVAGSQRLEATTSSRSNSGSTSRSERP